MSMYTYTHAQLFYGPLGFCLELPGSAGTRKVIPGSRKVKPIITLVLFIFTHMKMEMEKADRDD